MSSISWTNSSGGSWVLGSNWSGGNVPGNNDSATIAVAPGAGLAGYTVVIETMVDVGTLTLDQAAATLEVEGGMLGLTASLATQLYLEAGTLALDYSTLTGTVTQTGGVFGVVASSEFEGGNGTLQNVTWRGDLLPTVLPGLGYEDETTLFVDGSLTLTGAGGSGPGTLTLNQPGLAVDFQGTQTLDNATILLGAAPADGIPILQTDGTLTFGAGLVLKAVAAGNIEVGAQLTNDGRITTASGAYLSIGDYYGDPAAFSNAGVIGVAAGATVDIQTIVFDNSGKITVSAGGTLGLQGDVGGDQNGTLQNSGAIVVDGVLQLSGTLTTAEIVALDLHVGAGGRVVLSYDGTLMNGGDTLVLGKGGTIPSLDVQGTIVGGTISQAGGISSLNGATLSGVTLAKSLFLTQAGQSLTIDSTGGSFFARPEDLVETGAGAILTLNGIETLSGDVLTLGSESGDTINADGTLTLGAATHVHLASGVTNIGSNAYSVQGTVINRGAISTSVGTTLAIYSNFENAGKISLSSNSELFLAGSGLSNTGQIVLNQSTLLLGNVNAAELKEFTLVRSNVALAGTLTATGDTIDVGSGSSIGLLRIGVQAPGIPVGSASIVGGTIHDEGGVSFIGTVALTGVTYQGNLDLTAPDSDLVVTNLTLETAAGAPDGTLVVSGTNAGLDFGDGSTLNDVTIDLASFNGASIGANTANAVFGSHVTINETGPFVATIGGGGTLTSAATINVVGTPSQAGGLQIAGGAFFNNGTITIAPTAYLTLSSTYLQNDSSIQSSGPLAVDGTGIFVNDGTVVASNSLLLASAETVNRGTLSISGDATLTLKNYYDNPQPTGTSFENAGVVMLTGAGVREVLSHGVPGVAVVNDSGATLEGTGTFISTLVNDGKVDAVGGALTLVGNIAGVGQLDISADATLSVVSPVVNGQTATFGGADGVLGLAPKTFLGQISGFAAGDTIDLLQTAASGASFKGDSIVLTLTAGGSLTLRTVGALSGSLAVTSDGNDGTLIGFVGAAVHAADVPAGAWDQASPAATSVPEMWERFVPTADGLQPAWFAGLGHYGALFN